MLAGDSYSGINLLSNHIWYFLTERISASVLVERLEGGSTVSPAFIFYSTWMQEWPTCGDYSTEQKAIQWFTSSGASKYKEGGGGGREGGEGVY